MHDFTCEPGAIPRGSVLAICCLQLTIERSYQTHMSKPLNVLNSAGGGCAPCNSTGCGTCGPTPAKEEAPQPIKLSRRQMGRIALAASTGALLSSCAQPKEAPKETKEAAKATPDAAGVPLSEDLNVVQ